MQRLTKEELSVLNKEMLIDLCLSQQDELFRLMEGLVPLYENYMRSFSTVYERLQREKLRTDPKDWKKD